MVEEFEFEISMDLDVLRLQQSKKVFFKNKFDAMWECIPYDYGTNNSRSWFRLKYGMGTVGCGLSRHFFNFCIEVKNQTYFLGGDRQELFSYFYLLNLFTYFFRDLFHIKKYI